MSNQRFYTPVAQVTKGKVFRSVLFFFDCKRKDDATAFDLIRYEDRIGGLDRVATLLQEMGEFIDGEMLLEVAKIEQVDSHIQRLGYLLEKIGNRELATKLYVWIDTRRPRKTPLKPGLFKKGCRSDERWKVIVNTDVEGEL